MPEVPFPTVTVNGQPLPEAAFTFELKRLVRFYSEHLPPEQVQAQLPDLRRRAVDQAVGARLLLDEAERLAIDVPEDTVDARLADLAREAGGKTKFKALLRKSRQTEADLRVQIRRGRRVDLLIERLTADAPEPTEDEIRAHFEAHRAEYRRAERVQARHILAKPADRSPEARREARDRLEAVRQRIEEGADFAGEAAAHSDCPSGRKAGGSLGWVSRGMLVPAFDAVLFAAGSEDSAIIETPLGFHLVRRETAEPTREADFDEARESVRDFLRHARRGACLAEHVAELRARADVRVTAAGST